ncbi:terminase large subunit [Apilactobacillus apisilvae]|uniref:terminase large subunit n=1 Tax=Apilactobacillus apisilvae TaxID=2923364 RepID=UPI00294FF3E9|nr:terminase large subunit [Apilactobacillus apisilvae]
MSNQAAAEEIKKINPSNGLITCDSAEPKTIAEMGRSGLGLYLMAAVKGASRRQGFKWLQDLREIVIDPERCPNSAREFTTYELERDKDGNLKADYPDGNDHTLDAIRYSCERLSRKGGFRRWKK